MLGHTLSENSITALKIQLTSVAPHVLGTDLIGDLPGDMALALVAQLASSNSESVRDRDMTSFWGLGLACAEYK
jgi:hypothetical protein